MQCNRASTANGDGIGVHGKGIVLCDLARGGVYQQEGVVIAREGKIGTEMALQ